MPKVKVTLAERSYDITIESGLLPRIGKILKPMLGERNIVVTDESVGKLYLHNLSNSFSAAGLHMLPIVLPVGEQTKSFSQFEHLVEQILALQPDRKTTLIALGGGVIGDITGFAASVVLRGLPFVQIPTTLLAQVDSSVGGKTAINAGKGKNLVGSFYQPKAVLIDPDVLTTLPKREWLAGYAEVVKYGLIKDAQFFDWLEANTEKLLSGDASTVAQAIEKSCTAKAAIVAADETEQGERALLNFGHTFGHALEADTGFSDTLLHGEAVAIGMMQALEFSAKQGLMKPVDVARVKAHFEVMGLPTSPLSIRKDWAISSLMGHFKRDKKAENGALTFILAKGIGQAFVAKEVSPAAVQQFLEEGLAAH